MNEGERTQSVMKMVRKWTKPLLDLKFPLVVVTMSSNDSNTVQLAICSFELSRTQLEIQIDHSWSLTVLSNVSRMSRKTPSVNISLETSRRNFSLIYSKENCHRAKIKPALTFKNMKCNTKVAAEYWTQFIVFNYVFNVTLMDWTLMHCSYASAPSPFPLSVFTD